MHHRINNPSVISESLDGEVVVIHLASGTYYSLRGTAARIWDAVAAGRTTDDVTTDVSSAFDTAGVDVAGAVEGFLVTLATEGLLVPGERPPTPAPLPAAAAMQPWIPPVLETYTDMQDLILLDPVHEVEPARGWPVAADPPNG